MCYGDVIGTKGMTRVCHGCGRGVSGIFYEYKKNKTNAAHIVYEIPFALLGYFLKGALIWVEGP